MALRSAHNINITKELDVRGFEEFILSGSILHKSTYKFWSEKDREDVFIQAPNVNRMFFNTDIADVRLLDLTIIGEIIDVPMDTIIDTFAETREDEDLIRRWYSNKDNRNSIINQNGLSADQVDSLDFYIAEESEKCRLIEVWYQPSEWRLYVHDTLNATYKMYPMDMEDALKAENERRLLQGAMNGVPEEEIPLLEYEEKRESVWKVKILTPFGQCLFESETPYKHGSHPYTMKLYPLIDGEVWGLVEDIIDQQRYINRLISLLDFIMGSSAKGVLLVPEDAIPKDMDISDFSTEWSKFNGVIKIKQKPGYALPLQISSHSTNIGAGELLSLQMKLIMDISGIQTAIQGQEAKSGTPSWLYRQEAQNATLNTKDYFDTYAEFKKQRDYKVLKLITQYYNEPRYLSIAGSKYTDQVNRYDPEFVNDIDFDVRVTQSQDTPVYRQIIDDTLFRLLENQMIDVEMFLENSSLPFADNLLEAINRRKQQVQQTGDPNQLLSPDLLGRMEEGQQQAMQGLNPQAKAVIEKLLAGQTA